MSRRWRCSEVRVGPCVEPFGKRSTAFYGLRLGDTARPRKTKIPRLRRNRSSLLRRPRRRPRLDLRTVVILSTAGTEAHTQLKI